MSATSLDFMWKSNGASQAKLGLRLISRTQGLKKVKSLIKLLEVRIYQYVKAEQLKAVLAIGQHPPQALNDMRFRDKQRFVDSVIYAVP